MPNLTIASFEDACKNQGLDPTTVLPDVSCLPEVDRKAVIAFAKRCIIQRAINEDWEADWADNDQQKYYCWLDVEPDDDGSSGFRLSYGGYDYVFSRTFLGVRLFYPDAKTARYEFETFREMHEDMILIPRLPR
jgi:hypothetical protein